MARVWIDFEVVELGVVGHDINRIDVDRLKSKLNNGWEIAHEQTISTLGSDNRNYFTHVVRLEQVETGDESVKGEVVWNDADIDKVVEQIVDDIKDGDK